jgi:glycosyltransferase involved in cell wall biosynthesis
MASPRILVSVTNDLYTDQRVHKVCTFLKESGWDVCLIGRKRRASVELPPRSYQTKRIRLIFEKGALFYAFFNFRLFFRLVFSRCDAYLSNDLDTLLASYLASKIRRKPLIYDTHELFTEVPELVCRPKVRGVWLAIEKYIFPRLKHVYTVNQSISDIYIQKYKVPVNVVRNVSPLWNPSNLASKTELGIPEGKHIIILQGAGINVDRGAEEAVEAMRLIDGELKCVLLIVGDGDVVPALKEKVEQFGLRNRVLFFARQPYNRMMNYTAYADIGLSLDKNTNPNYRYSLPNKVFDYMHTQTAIIATNLVEVRRIVEGREIGEILDKLSPKILANRIQSLLEDQDKLSRLKANCLIASQTENWENETSTLRDIYNPILENLIKKKGGLQ